jgi:hypothetical protein
MPQDEASTGQLLSRLTEQLSTLVRDEAALAVVKLRRGVPPVPQETVANVKDDAAIIRRAVTQ